MTLSDLARRIHDWISRYTKGHLPLSSTEEEFNRTALLLFRFQFDSVHSYQRLCQALGVTPDSIRDWTDLPAVPTAAFKEYEMTSLPPQARERVFHSSGTTGQTRSRHWHNAESLALYRSKASRAASTSTSQLPS